MFLVGGRFFSQPLVGGRWLFRSVVDYFLGKWSMVGGRWSVVGVTVVGRRWSVVGGWSVGGGFVLRPIFSQRKNCK